VAADIRRPHRSTTLAPGTAHRSDRRPLPAGADAIPVEATDAGTETVEIRAASRSGQHVRRAGEDVTGYDGAAARANRSPRRRWGWRPRWASAS
jgi:molybdopterin biosynthesis enzyme